MVELKQDLAKSSDLEAIHTEALDRYQLIENKEDDNRQLSVEDISFAQVAGQQWQEHGGRGNDDNNDNSSEPDRPRFEINTLAAAIDTVVGNQRQNDIGISVFPTQQGNNPDVAEILDGIIRNIEYQSKARNVYDSAFDETLNGGYGGWRIVAQFIEDSFDQELRIKPINAATTSLWFDVNAKEYDKSDAKYAFLTFSMNKKDFAKTYPDALTTDFQQDRYLVDGSNCFTWFNDDNIRIAEYWRKVPKKKELYLMSDGSLLEDLTDEQLALAKQNKVTQQGVFIAKQRTADSVEVERYLMNGAEVLEAKKVEPGRFIPLIPLFGKITHIEEQEHVRGVVRFARDPSRMYNFTRSSIVEKAALAPTDPYWMTPEMAKGHTPQLARLNIDNPPVAYFNRDKENPNAIPQRSGAPQVEQALIEAAQTAKQDIQLTMGIAQTQMMLPGAADRRSAEAVNAQQTIGDTGTFVFTDNLTKSIEYCGRILVDLIPKIYDTERQIRIVQPDGEGELITINGVDGGNDIRMGKFDVIVKTGPAFASLREKAADLLINLADNPAFAQLVPDLIAKHLPLDGTASQELHDRIRKQMIQSGIVEGTPEEMEKLGITKEQQLIQQLTPQIRQQVLQEANEQFLFAEAQNSAAKAQETLSKIESNRIDDGKTLAETDNIQTKTVNEAIAGMEKMLENFLKQQALGVPITINDHDNRIQQQDLIEESQQLVSPGPTSEQELEFGIQPNI